ncbi:hypothetical protein [Priestia megaterium]|uniref:hypothetical protein n=1 Tax=Priestia megaterium TaxID=1404 RepID=UPI001866AB49|nr:hypothetical protein [Priestia megaterium]MBE2973415.1 hypothetical protein [Priestia megaterium]
MVKIKEKDAKWAAPLLDGGSRAGFNNPGIEQFRGDPLLHTAKETIQNAIDAKNPQMTGPVEVHFSLHNLPAKEFPDKKEFIRILESCKEFPKWKKNEEVQEFIKKALELMNKPKIPILKISDYNTTGLTGSKNDPDTDSDEDQWNSLVKSSGVSDKPNGSGGSYGIGKNAPFTTSLLRTVFYCTRDYHENVAFQGVSQLFTHKNNAGKTTQGTCYLGEKEDKKPIFELDGTEISDFFYKERISRNSYGTDIFVVGTELSENWKKDIVTTILEYFFVAIHQDNLVIKIYGEAPNDAIIIDTINLPELINRYVRGKSRKYAANFYDCLTKGKKYNFNVYSDIWDKEEGKVELYIHQHENAINRIAKLRATGMRIENKKSIPISIDMVLIASGKGINDFLRLLEPPTHDRWSYKLSKKKHQQATAKEILESLDSEINKIIEKDYMDDVKGDQLDFNILNQHLSDETIGDSKSHNRRKATGFLKKEMKIISLEKKDSNSAEEKNKNWGYVDSGDHSEIEDDEEVNSRISPENLDIPSGSEPGPTPPEPKPGPTPPEPKPGPTPPEPKPGPTPPEPKPGPTPLEPEPRPAPPESESQSGLNNPEDLEGKKVSAGKKIKNQNQSYPMNYRYFQVDANKGLYNLNITSKDSLEGYLWLKIVGEDVTKKETLVVNEFIDREIGKNVNVTKEGVVGPIKLYKGQKRKFTFKTETKSYYAIEVNFVENYG